MSDNDATTQSRRRRWVLPVVIGAVVLALGGGIGLGLALSGGGGETPEISPTPSTSSTNSGGGGGSRSSDTGGGNTNSGGGATSQPTSPPTAPPAQAGPKPTFTNAVVSPNEVKCGANYPKKYDLTVSWTTKDAESIDMYLGGSNYLLDYRKPQGSSGLPYECGGATGIRLVAHGPGGETSTTLTFDVRYV